MDLPVYHTTKDLARLLDITPAALRLRRRLGYVVPDAETLDGAALYSRGLVERIRYDEARRAYLTRVSDSGRWLQRRARKEPEQLVLDGRSG